ncbi:hypothetical protein MP638_006684 [Amoeboaphelidium occidentale]|nr:hypothetical protein MP638_006684 [Amoeboaphelidium occidentale]
MSVLLETSLGELVIDLYTDLCPVATLNFLKLCKIKYYNCSLFYSVEPGFVARCGKAAGILKGVNEDTSVYGLLRGPKHRYFKSEIHPLLKHNKRGIVSMATMPPEKDQNDALAVNGSEFFLTFGDNLTYLDGKYTVFGEVAEGFDVLDKIEDTICDEDAQPLQDIRIKHTIILDDPFDDPAGLEVPNKSPEPTREILETGRLRDDEKLVDDEPEEVLEKKKKEREAQAKALTLEMLGDLPFAEIKPPENVLFVCKLNPVTRSEDLETIFSRFGKIASCEVIRDKDTGDSLCYAFIEFEEKEACEEAYFKMQNVLIDARRIHVDFSQSVSKLQKQWVDSRKDKIRKNILEKDLKGYDYVFQFDYGRPDKSKDKHRRDRSPPRRRRSRSRSPPRRQGDYDRRK